MPVLYAKIVNGVISGNVQTEPFGSGSVSGVSGTTELTANIQTTWDWGVSPVDSNGTAIYPNWPYDDTGIFVGDYLKGSAASFVVNWNVQPSAFTAANVITLFEKTGTIENFTSINPTKYTFSYLPNVTPAQVSIPAGSVTNGSLKLNNTVYSQAVLTEYRPYTTIDISNYNSSNNTIRFITDTSVTPNIKRYYIVAPNSTQNTNVAQLKITFNNFNIVPTTFTEAGYTSATATSRPYYFDSTDVVSAISYSHYVSGTTYPTNTSTSYGFFITTTLPGVYAWPSSTTLATQTTKVRATPLVTGTNAYRYAGVLKFNVAKGSYADKTSAIANVDGIPLYLGIFGDTTTGAAQLALQIIPTRPTGVRYGNYTVIKFRLNHYIAMCALTFQPTVTIGSLSALVPDTTDPFGLTYTANYTPSTTQTDYSQSISFSSNSIYIPNFAAYGFGVLKSIPSTAISFGVKQSPTKYTASNLAENIKFNTLTFTVDTPIYADTSVAAQYLVIQSPNNVVIKSFANNDIGMLPTTGTTGKTTISILLPPDEGVLVNSTRYTIIIPTIFGISDYGTYLEDLTKTNITQTFTVDSNPITVTSFSFNNTISITNPRPYISNIKFNKAILSINTTNPLVTIADKDNSTVPIISIPYSTTTLAVPNAGILTLSNYDDTILNSQIYDPVTLQTTNYTFNTNRELRVDKTYTATVHTDYCKDRYKNSSNIFTYDFTLTKTSLSINSSYLESKLTGYDRVQVILQAPYTLYANTNNIVVSLTDNTNTYTSASSDITSVIDGSTLTLTFNTSIYKTSTNYTLTIPSGFVEDYVGNKNIAYTKSFSTVSSTTSGQIVIAGLYTTSGRIIPPVVSIWTVPFGVSSISLVAIGGGSSTGGALAWINNIPVVAGDVFKVTITNSGDTVIYKNDLTIVTAQASQSSVVRSMPLFYQNITANKTVDIDYGGQAGGLGKKVPVPGGTTNDYNSSPGGAGGYIGYNPDPALCAHGLDYNNNIVIENTSNNANGSSLLGTNPGGGTKYGAGNTVYSRERYTDGNSDPITFSEQNPGAVRIMWGPNRAYPSTNVADQ